MRFSRCLLLLLTLLPGACQEPGRGGDRAFQPVHWDTIAIYGSPSDTVLMIPNGMRRWGDGVVVMETRYSRVVAFDGNGNLRWIYRNVGQGPEELLRPSDAMGLASGDLLVLDQSNFKLLSIGPNGRFVSERRLPELNFRPSHLLPIGDGLAFVTGAGLRLTLLDVASGQPLEPIPLPLSEPVSQGFRSIVYGDGDPARGVWAVAMRFGPDWWVGNDREVIGLHGYVDEVLHQYLGRQVEIAPGTFINDPSSVDRPLTLNGPSSMSIDGDEVFMITGGSFTIPDEKRDRLDVYSLSGEHLRRYRLPGEWNWVVKQGERYFFLRLDPYPQLLVMEMRAQ